MASPVRFAAVLVLTALTLTAATGALSVERINTGERNGAYYSGYCPLLEAALTKARFEYLCEPTKGSVENIARVHEAPLELGFAQLDVLALDALGNEADALLTTIRSDLGRECLFIVTKNHEIQTFAELTARANELSVVLPPEGSGHAATFRFLLSIAGTNLSKVKAVTHAASTDAALEQVLSGDGSDVTLFVQIPEPNNERFQKVDKSGAHFVPVIDRTLLRQEIAGKKVYFAEETKVRNANWLRRGQTLVTACTPLVLFTGASEKIAAGSERQNHVDLIRTIQALPHSLLVPKEGVVSSWLQRGKTLSAEGVERFLAASQVAREKASEAGESAKSFGERMLERAKEIGGKAAERAKELGDKALERAGDMATGARERVDEVLGGAEPESKPKDPDAAGAAEGTAPPPQ